MSDKDIQKCSCLLPADRVLDIAHGSLKHTEATAAKLRRFIAKYETKPNTEAKQ